MTNKSISDTLIAAKNECAKYYYSDGNAEYIKQFKRAEYAFKRLAEDVQFAKKLGDRRESLWRELDRHFMSYCWELMSKDDKDNVKTSSREGIQELRKQLGVTNDH